MKNLHRKISAMLLAGMVVFGGVAVSGVSSFAASSKVYSVASEYEVKKMSSICKSYGEVIVLKNEDHFKQLIGECAKSDLYNVGRPVSVRNPYELPGHLQRAQYSGIKFVKVQCNNVLYLIKLKQL